LSELRERGRLAGGGALSLSPTWGGRETVAIERNTVMPVKAGVIRAGARTTRRGAAETFTGVVFQDPVKFSNLLHALRLRGSARFQGRPRRGEGVPNRVDQAQTGRSIRSRLFAHTYPGWPILRTGRYAKRRQISACAAQVSRMNNREESAHPVKSCNLGHQRIGQRRRQ
jgi:hypothetical protein